MSNYAILHAALDKLGHPDRLRILHEASKNGPVSPKDVAAVNGSSLGTIAYHFRTMAADGLLEPSGTKPVRGATQHFYRLSSRGRRLHRDLLGTPA